MLDLIIDGIIYALSKLVGEHYSKKIMKHLEIKKSPLLSSETIMVESIIFTFVIILTGVIVTIILYW